MSARVLFVHPYIPARFNGAPIGLLYVAATTERAGHEVRVLDLQADDRDGLVEQTLREFAPHVVGIASTSPSHKAALDLAARIKALAPGVVVVKGGVHETYC